MFCKISYTLILLKAVIFICLSVFLYVFYINDIAQKYAYGHTTLVNYQENMSESDIKSPFFTFCMSPRAKKSILEGYNMSLGALDEPNSNEKKILVNMDKTIEALFRQSYSYQVIHISCSQVVRDFESEAKTRYNFKFR